MESKFKQVKKRDGRIVPFDQERITTAVRKAMEASGEGDPAKDPERVSDRVVSELNKRYPATHTPAIEEIQDVVEESLILMDFPKVAKAYILYRQKRAEVRSKSVVVPERVRQLAAESKKYFRNPLAEFIYYRTYSRWIEEENRRETWVETVDRYISFMKENLGNRLTENEYAEVRSGILNQEVMPSMRLMWSAGKAAAATHVASYNCSFTAPRRIEDFAEIMYLLMCGTGVGFSVENQNIQEFPIVKRQIGKILPVHTIEDSKEGWGNALTLGLKSWYQGMDISLDYSKLRPAGARLKTMGGRSSGPEPLRSLLDFSRSKILARQGRRLSSLDVHDIICKIGEIVVAGGVRRCLPQNTLVYTNNGLKPIKNIREGDEVLTSRGQYRKVIATQHTGAKQLVDIHTQLGVFQSTPEHRWAVLADLFGGIKWVEARDLTQNDALIHVPEVVPGRKTAFPQYRYDRPKNSTTTVNIRIPELDEDTAWLVGYFHGDGYVYRKNDTYGEIMFACSPDMPRTAERLKKNLERFGVKASIARHRYDRSIRVKVKSNQLANYFYQFKQPKKPLIVPDFILEAGPVIRASYIAGVFDSDGSVKSRNGKKVRPIVAGSIYIDWLRQLRALLASLGVSANVRQSRPRKGSWQALYLLIPVSMEAFSRFANLMSVRSEKWKNDATSMTRKKEQNSFIVPKDLLALSPYRVLFDRAYYAPSSKVSLSFSKFERELQRQTGIAAVSVASPSFQTAHEAAINYRPVKIKKITIGGVDNTFDIQVEGDECFVADGMLVHNSALISLSDLNDDEMRRAKQGPFYFSDPQRQMANNSTVYNTKPGSAEFLEEWLALAKSGTGERGIFNRGGLQKQLPERRWKTFQKHWATCGTNPCVTGDTLVYAADGRGSVSIKKLAESGEDVPVFCLDNNGRIAIRYMRNPRLTGAKVPVFKIILDDGSVIKATANHKFRMKSGEYREVKDLLPGDSLAIVTRFETSIKDLFPNASVNAQDYWWINDGRFSANFAEHRLIASFHYNRDIPSGYVVHHKDKNAKNNQPDNLEILIKEEHDALHAALMVGDHNPMRRASSEWSEQQWQSYRAKHSKNNGGEKNKNFSGVTDEQLKEHAFALTKRLGRRFSHKDWVNYAKKNCLPQHFSKWRRDHLGGILGLAKWAAHELGFEHMDADPRVVDSYKKYTAQGYDCEIVQGRLAIIKNCELCGRKFRVGLSSREYGVCSISCGQKRKWQDNTYKSWILNLINVNHAKRKQAIREAQAKVYSDLRFTLGRSPRKKEWVLFCKENGISPEISRASSPFRTYNNLKEYALQYNHKVISVEFCGYEDVYNGTVDEFHNFFVGGFQSKTKNNKRKIIYLNNRNCGEIVLRDREFCNLSEVVARPEDTEETLLAKIRIATILGTYQAALTNFPYLSKAWKENCEEERLLGVSITGQWDSPAVRNPEILRKLRERAIEVNKEYAKRFGINESTCVTCVKPSGCRPWYALTTTDQGLLTLEELFENHDEQKQWDIYRGSERVIQNPHPAAIIKTYHNGPAKTLKIKMSYGLTVESTPNHQWFVSFHYDRSRGNLYQRCPVNQWVEAKDLRSGDVIEVKLGVYDATNHTFLKKINSLAIKMRSDARAIAQPDSMNEDLAWLMGYLWGDGAMSPEKYRIRFIDEHVDNLLKAQRIIKEQFGLESKLHQASGHRNAHTLEIGSKMLWHWLIKNDVFKYYADRIDIIPRLVRGSSCEDVIAFIAGLLDADGWVGKHSNSKGYTITITTADKFFAQHLQDTAWAVGLGFGRSLNSQGSNLQQQKEMYLLTLGRAVKPEAFVVLQKNSIKLQRASQDKEFKNWLWQNPKANSLIVGKIISIEEGDTLPTYDIEVENHWYYAGAVKSHNTVSQLVDAASGMHPRHAPYYIRRVRISATDPLFQMLREQKFPYHPEVGQLESTATTFVLDFPVKAPAGAAFRNDASAIEQLEYWRLVKENFTEHNPSVTISVGADEWISVADWLWANWDILGGLSFLPREEHVYQLAPYEEISEARYNELAAALPEIDFSAITVYEKDDSTTGSKELACVGNVCEVDVAEPVARQQSA